jgi:predicted DNA-binding ribbon-helix-helix protein
MFVPRTTTLPKAEICARYASGESIQRLADAYDRNFATMRENLHRWGASVRRRGPARTYKLDEDFFESIDTETKVYWLGFAFADGSVQQTTVGNWTFRVELQRADEGHLYKLRAALGSDAPIVPTDHDGNLASYLMVCSVRLCRDLIRHGCIPNKTYIGLATPILSSELYRHFYRGLTDGDGGIRPYPTAHSWIFDTVGAPVLIADYQRWLILNAGLGETKLIRRGIVSVVEYTGGVQVERIARLLYEDAAVFLDRKFMAYQELCHRPGRQLSIA